VAAPSFLFQEKYGSLSATGFAKEANYGTAATVTQFVPTSANTFVQDPSLFFPDLMQAIRDKQVYPLYGEEKNSGAITAPLFPTNGIQLLSYAIGADSATPAQSFTLVSPSPYAITNTLGSNVITLTPAVTTPIPIGASITATGLPTGCVVLSATTSGTTTTISLNKVSTGAVTTTLTISTNPLYQHNIAQTTSAPFLPSVTVEKNIGNYQSLVFAGCLVNKYQLKAGTGNKEAEFTADMIAQSVSVSGTPTAVVLVNESPYVFAEFNLLLGGYNLYQATNFQLDIENNLKETYTFNGSHTLQFLTPTQLKVSGSFDVVFDTLNAYSGTSTINSLSWSTANATISGFSSTTGLVAGLGVTGTGILPGTTITSVGTTSITISQTPVASGTSLTIVNPYDFFTQSLSSVSTTAALSFTLAHPASGGSVIITMPAVKLSKTDQKVAPGSVIMETVNFEAYYTPAGSLTSTPSAQSSSTINAVVLNGVSTQF
jgi:hypothetical protein